jgi:hypothetical protein
MSDKQAEMMVLKDADGNLYLLSRETLAQARVPEEQRTEVLERIGAAGDTAGFALNAYLFASGLPTGIVSPRDPASIVSPRDAASIGTAGFIEQENLLRGPLR